MHIDWQAVIKEQNEILRLLLITAKEPEILEGLRKGFPQFFSKEARPLRIPLSVIRAWRYPEGFNMPSGALRHFGVPFIEFGDAVGQDHPKEWDSVLKGESIYISISDDDKGFLQAPFRFVQRHGERFLVAENDPGEYLVVVPEKYIDLSS